MLNKKQQQQQRMTKNLVRDIAYQHQWRQRHTSPEEADDRYQNGELLVAAGILTDLVASRAKQRNLLEAAQAVSDAKEGKWDYNSGSYYEAGYPPFPVDPPANWPLSKDEWPVERNQDTLIQKATGLLIAEAERHSRMRGHIWTNGTNALDDDSRELAAKRREISDRRHRKAWSRRNKSYDLKVVDSADSVPYAADVTFDAAASNASDLSSIQPRTISREEADEFEVHIDYDDL